MTRLLFIARNEPECPEQPWLASLQEQHAVSWFAVQQQQLPLQPLQTASAWPAPWPTRPYVAAWQAGIHQNYLHVGAPEFLVD